jgi:hypothetical protein
VLSRPDRSDRCQAIVGFASGESLVEWGLVLSCLGLVIAKFQVVFLGFVELLVSLVSWFLRWFCSIA